MINKKSILTKVAKGVAFGDVSNASVRNILTEISKTIFGGITEQEMFDTMEQEFKWECPYTGRDLKSSIISKDGSYATDHIYPQNREWCGLNVKGNLIIVDREANNAKKGLDLDTFMEEDSDFWSKLGVDRTTRMARLKKIKDFQQKCKYDSEKIRAIVSPLLNERYEAIKVEQEKCIAQTLKALENSGLYTKVNSASISQESRESVGHLKLPELVFVPSNEEQFKNELIKSKKARFVLTYNTGHVKETYWKADSFDVSSNLRGNIQSKPFWRRKESEGLVKVEAFIE